MANRRRHASASGDMRRCRAELRNRSGVAATFSAEVLQAPKRMMDSNKTEEALRTGGRRRIGKRLIEWAPLSDLSMVDD